MTLYSRFSRLGFLRSVGKINRNVDRHFFDVLDTPEKAYVVGLFLADGCFNGTRIVIKLQRQDAELLREIKRIIGKPIPPVKVTGNVAVASFGSKALVAGLKTHVGEKKTERLRAVKLDPTLFGPFLRGFFDGDGSVSKRAARKNQIRVEICSISRQFLCWLQAEVMKRGIRTSLIVERRKGKRMQIPGGRTTICQHDMFRLHFGTHQSRVSLFRLLYPDASVLKLDRKYKQVSRYYANAVQILAAKKPKPPDGVIEQLFARYAAGESMRALARELGRCNTLLRHWFISLGHSTDLRNA